jgi:hypothetical protein
LLKEDDPEVFSILQFPFGALDRASITSPRAVRPQELLGVDTEKLIVTP